MRHMTKARCTLAVVLAKIYTRFATHSINLYIGISDPINNTNQKKLYQSYLTIAVDMAEAGYINSEYLQECLKQQNLHASNDQEKTIASCLNTYVFYLAQRGGQDDNDNVVRALPKLVKITSAMQGKPESLARWCNYQDTLAWANLYLRRESAQKTKEIVQSLMDNPDISQEWKKETKERYDFYNKFQMEEANKVILSLTPTA
jgi:hypothetical protein